MSAASCVCAALGYGLLVMASLPHAATGRNCSHPLVPEHGGFRCKPSPCSGFTPKSIIQFFCEPGFVLPRRHSWSKCQHGQWHPSVPTCFPRTEGPADHQEKVANSIPSVATTAVGVSIFLLTTTACLVIKSRLFSCYSRRRSSDQLDLVVDGFPVSLPTYEEAVYSSWGRPITSFRGPTQLLLAQDASEHSPLTSLLRSDSANQSAENPPPPYEEVHSRSRDGGAEDALQTALPVDKTN